jgi:hypothetical protein
MRLAANAVPRRARAKETRSQVAMVRCARRAIIKIVGLQQPRILKTVSQTFSRSRGAPERSEQMRTKRAL